MYDLNDSPYLDSWSPYRGKFTFLARFLLFLVIIYVANVVASIPSMIGALIVSAGDLVRLTEEAVKGNLAAEAIFDAVRSIAADSSLHPAVMALSKVGLAATVGGIVLYVRLVEGRTLRSVGFSLKPRHLFVNLAVGGAIGCAVPLLVYLISHLIGAVTTVGVWNNGWWLLLFLVGFVAQTLAEELLYRGYFLSVFLRPGGSPWLGILVISVFHVIPYIGVGMNAFGFINTALMGFLLTVLALRTGSIWLTTGLSAAWNLVVSCILGNSYLPTLLRLIPTVGHDLVSGGTAGMECGLLMTLLLLIGLILALFLPSWRKTRTPSDIFMR